MPRQVRGDLRTQPCTEDAIETNRPITGIAKAAPAHATSYDRIMNDAR